ncbi:hypothetical protein ACFFKU_12700 [Kineococcus gynurae]|uniref:Lanthionine synthetase-like protein n=1 Tax=Kineococcus gynurae TaxID=452979 RepID=A0ABV5LQM1_9ACTN
MHRTHAFPAAPDATPSAATSDPVVTPDPVEVPAHALAAAARGARWLRRSGIQSPSGGYHSWFDREQDAYPFEYSEVTGYLVTYAAWLAAGAGDILPDAIEDGEGPHAGATVLDDADRAVHWLATAVQPEPGAFRCLEASAAVGRFQGKADRLYTFDAGIILQGLVAHHVATGSEPARRTAVDTGEWLLRHVDAAGVVQPWPSAPGVTDWPDVPGDWSTRPGVHHAKIGIGLAALGELTGDGRFTAAAVAVCEDALRHQLPSGRFVTNPASDPVPGSTNIHPHCYAAEALWSVGHATGRADLVAASERATLWLLAATDATGHPLRRWTSEVDVVRHPRVDGVAQALRLAALHGLGGTAAARRLLGTVLAHQVEDPTEVRVHGGFAFGAGTAGEPLVHANVWVTAFAVQALVLAVRGGADPQGPVLDWRHLV